MKRTIFRSAIAAAVLCLSYAAVHAQDTEKEIERYREMISDPMSNPGFLAVDRGEALWHEKRGTKNVSLEGCDLGLGAGKLEGAYAQLPRYFADTDKVIRLVWILAGSLAAVSGILWAYFRPGVKWDMGVQMLLLIFCAMTIGGLGTAFGAIVGSIIVGIAVEVSTLWIPSDLKYASALVALIIILLVRPQGLFGRKERLG